MADAFWLVSCAFLWPWLTIVPWFIVVTWLEDKGYRELRDVPALYRELGWLIGVPLTPYLAIGAWADIQFNWTWGTVIFRERPRELFFTDRLKRQYRDGHPRAAFWKEMVDRINPGHI